MAKYLDSILKTMPAVQARQITELLNELKIDGEIRNADEYHMKLKELSNRINSVEPKPSMEFISSLVWHFCSSDAHNIMMKSLKNDIEALYSQIDEMGQKIDDHFFLVMNNLFADMEKGLNDQEKNIRRLEWLANNNNEFSIALVNNFKSASLNRVSRSELSAENLYFDNRTYQNKTATELPNAIVSENGNKLLLSTINNTSVNPISVRLLSDSSSYGTEIKSETNNHIENLIDKERGTYWTRFIYLSKEVPKVTTVLEFDLGNAKDIDYIIIQGACEIPFYVDSIQGISSDGSLLTLVDEEIEIEKNARIDFEKKFLRGVIVTFSIRTYDRAEFYTNKLDPILNILNPEDKFNEVKMTQSLGPLATEVLSSKNLANILNVPSGESQQINSFIYPFALDNVWFGNSLYEDSGIFVSKPIKDSDFGVLAVQTIEDLSSDICNSIEYEIIKKDISPKYKETKFPIPYLGQTSVTNERLILTNLDGESTINNIGALRFCPLITTNDINLVFSGTFPMHIYKNGEALSNGTDYEIAISLNSSNSGLNWQEHFTNLDDFSKYTLTPTKMWIKIKEPESNAVYTVDYKIRTSDSSEDNTTIWLNKDKDIFLSDNGRVNFLKENPDVTIDSEIYLQITLRRNAASKSTSPVLKEYALLGAKYNG